MKAELTQVNNQEEHRKGLVGSIAFHAVLLLILIMPFIKFPIPPPGQQGIVVNLGIPDSGQGNDRPETQNKEIVPPTPPSSAKPVVNKDPEPQVMQTSVKEIETSKEVITANNEEIRIKKAEEEEKKREHEAELQKQRELEEAKRQAELEAQRKAEEEARKQAQYEQNKKQFGELIAGAGKGNTDVSGSQGVQDGDPDASKLEGISTGSGVVGGGLSNRGVLYEPDVKDSSQKTGRVVVSVCVDQTGNVISANYTQRGSTTTDSELRALAERSARKFKFSQADIDKQCGTITIDFKVQ